MIHGHVEETLNLSGMKIHGENPVGACRRDEICHQLGGNRHIKGKSTLLLDDMIDTAGTIVQGAQACADKGAREVWTACTHAVLSGPALERLQQSCLTQVIITNTIPIQEKQRLCPKIHQLSVAPLLGEAIRRIHADESVSSLFA